MSTYEVNGMIASLEKAINSIGEQSEGYYQNVDDIIANDTSIVHLTAILKAVRTVAPAAIVKIEKRFPLLIGSAIAKIVEVDSLASSAALMLSCPDADVLITTAIEVGFEVPEDMTEAEIAFEAMRYLTIATAKQSVENTIGTVGIFSVDRMEEISEIISEHEKKEV